MLEDEMTITTWKNCTNFVMKSVKALVMKLGIDVVWRPSSGDTETKYNKLVQLCWPYNFVPSNQKTGQMKYDDVFSKRK
jgi:hypothetical protein